MLTALRSWLGRKTQTRQTTTPRARLRCDQLEDRLTPTVDFAWADFSSYAELTNDPATALVKDRANDLAVDAAGNRYVLGLSQSADSRVYHVAKYNAADNSLAWVSTFGGTGSTYTDGGAVTVDANGNVYAALPTWVGSAGPVDIVKLNSSGGLEQSYTETRGTSDWTDNYHVIDITTDAAGSVFYTAAGYTVRLESQAGGLVKADDYGVGGYALALSPDGSSVYVTGRFSGTAVDFDPTRSYGDNRDILATTRRSRDTSYDVFILELNRNPTSGNMEFAWVGQVGSPHWDIAEDIVVSDTGVYVLGYAPSSSSDTNTSTDFDPGPGRYSLPVYSGSEYIGGGMFLIKLDTNNQFEWVKGLSGNGISGDSGSARGRLSLDTVGSVYVSDVFEGTVCDFDIEHVYPGDIDRVTNTASGNQLFVAKYSPSGAFRWASTVTGTGFKAPAGLAVTNDGIFALSTVARDTLTVTPSVTQFSVPTEPDLFLAKFTQTADPVMIYTKSVSQAEGNSGGTAFTFQVFLSDPVNYPITISYATADGTAKAGSDYTATSGTILFSPGQTTATVTVIVSGDSAVEPDETFALSLWSDDLGIPVSSALLAWASITNDDSSGGKGGGRK